MIESKTLGSAAGVQYQGVIDKTETNSLPSLANGVIVGRFKRGRMDKPFKVTASNYKALLGHDPSNPSYLAVEDAFKRGISEVSILRVGGIGGAAIKCVANFAEMSLPSFDREEVVPDSFVTVSRNGGEFKTYKLNPPMEGADFFAENFFSSDGKKVIFFDYPYGAGQLTDSNKDAICGIDSEGMVLTPDQGAINLMDLELFSGGHRKITPPYVLTKQHNWLTFKPTDGVSPEHDMFFSMIGGDSGASTITIHSCAVIEEYIDPNVCMPTFFTMKDDVNNSPMIIGDVHAKYRINGEPWQLYTAPASEWNSVYEFLNSIFHNDWPMFNIDGGGGHGAFNKSYLGLDLYGAESAPPFTRDQLSVVSPTPHTIEFAVTENSNNDLVYLAFGQDITMKSCAIGNWEGY